MGIKLQAGLVRRATWTIAITIGCADVVITHNWGRAGLYFLGAAITMSMDHRFTKSIDVAAVAAYTKGREHHDSDNEIAPVVQMSTRR